MRPSEREIASQPESRGNAISFIAGIRLIERGIQINKPAGFCIGHSSLERFGDPRVIVFYYKFRDLRPLARGKRFKLLDNFCGAHMRNDTVPRSATKSIFSVYLPIERWTPAAP